jgi:Flp pilus assembly pilin Flp
VRAGSYLASMGLRIRLGDESGQTTTEYALVIALTAIALVFALAVIPGQLFDPFWQAVKTALP